MVGVACLWSGLPACGRGCLLVVGVACLWSGLPACGRGCLLEEYIMLIWKVSVSLKKEMNDVLLRGEKIEEALCRVNG